MKYWTFLDYVNGRGENVTARWRSELPAKARAKIDARVRYLEAMRFHEPHILKPLSGDCDGLLELRVVFAGVQYRPICFKGPRDREITILIGAIEKGHRLRPPDACQTAKDRARSVSRNRAYLKHYDFDPTSADRRESL